MRRWDAAAMGHGRAATQHLLRVSRPVPALGAMSAACAQNSPLRCCQDFPLGMSPINSPLNRHSTSTCADLSSAEVREMTGLGPPHIINCWLACLGRSSNAHGELSIGCYEATGRQQWRSLDALGHWGGRSGVAL